MSAVQAAAGGPDYRGDIARREMRRDSAGSMNSKAGGMEAMRAYEMQKQRMAVEDREETIRNMMRDGQMTEEEAQVRFARMAMHEQQKKDENEGDIIKGIVAAGAGFQTTEQILDELLDEKNQNPFVKCVKDTLGISKIERAVAKEKMRRNNKNFRHRCPKIQATINSKVFDLVLGTCIVANSITVGISASYIEELEMDVIAENIFTFIFVCELCARFVADGWVWIFAWDNFLDFLLIVVTGVVPTWILQPRGIDAGAGMRACQVVRVLRLARLARMVRTVKQFKTLWTLIQGLTDGAKILIWMYVLLFTVLYILALFSVHWIGRARGLVNDDYTQTHFGTVPRALLTLFQTATLDSWSDIARNISRKYPPASMATSAIFMMTIMTTSLVLLNLVTAVIVQTTFARAAEDKELQHRALMISKNKEIEELKRTFDQMDADDSGFLSKSEWDRALLTNQKVIDKFEVLGIDEDEREEIWTLLDDGSGEVSVAKFASTLQALQGEAKAKAGFTIVKTAAGVNTKLEKLQRRIERQQALVDLTQSEFERLHRQLGSTLQDLCEFLTAFGACVPERPAGVPASKLRETTQLVKQKVIEIESSASPANSTAPAMPSPSGWSQNRLLI